MQRLYFLVERCYQMREPVLLVGETGSGKTTVCQLLSNVLGSQLHILNCHRYTETSDFLGVSFIIVDHLFLFAEKCYAFRCSILFFLIRKFHNGLIYLA